MTNRDQSAINLNDSVSHSARYTVLSVADSAVELLLLLVLWVTARWSEDVNTLYTWDKLCTAWS